MFWPGNGLTPQNTIKKKKGAPAPAPAQAMTILLRLSKTEQLLYSLQHGVFSRARAPASAPAPQYRFNSNVF